MTNNNTNKTHPSHGSGSGPSSGHDAHGEIVNIDFVGAIAFWGTVSTIATIVSFILIFTKGINYGIDFAGGSEVQVKFAQSVKAEDVRKFTEDQGFRNA